MRTTFIDKQREDTFTHDGYLVVDFLAQDELEGVRAGINELGFGTNSEKKHRISVNQEPVERKNIIFERFSPVLQHAADRFLLDHTLRRVAIFDKLPGGHGISVHQHPNIVDESKFRSISIWMPIAETTVDMGTLHVVKGSHRIFIDKIRTANDFPVFDGVSRRVIKKFSTPLLLKAGQAVIFDDRLIHWSPPNKSSMPRTAFQLIYAPKETGLIVYYRTKKEELSKYTLSDKTYREAALTVKKPEDMDLVGTINQSRPYYDNKRFISMMKNLDTGNTEVKGNLIQRLLNI